MNKYLQVFLSLFISLFISVIPAFLWPVGKRGFDVCNEFGIPFVFGRGRLCSDEVYVRVGTNIQALLLNMI